MLICLLAVIAHANAISHTRIRTGWGWIPGPVCDNHRPVPCSCGSRGAPTPTHLHELWIILQHVRPARRGVDVPVLCRFGRVIVLICVELNTGRVGSEPAFYDLGRLDDPGARKSRKTVMDRRQWKACGHFFQTGQRRAPTLSGKIPPGMTMAGSAGLLKSTRATLPPIVPIGNSRVRDAAMVFRKEMQYCGS